MKKRLLALLLCVAMLASLSVTAFAGEEEFTPADYKVTVGVSTTTDRDATNEMVDVFAGDQVTVTVTVTGSTFVAADVTLTYDTTNFELAEEAPVGWSGATPSDDPDYPGMKDDDLTPTGKLRFYNPCTTAGGSWEDGKILGTFTFTALPGEEAAMNVPFQVKAVGGEAYPNAYVAKEWSAGWSSEAAVPVKTDNLTNGHANIRLKEMTASVTAESGLSYKGDNTPLKLVKDGYTAKDNSTGASITDANIKYAVLTKAEADGTPYTGAEGTTESSSTSGFVAGKEPKTPTSYDDDNPTVTAAGDYVLFYQISRPGFVTVSDKVNVSVAKASITLNWTASELETVTAGKLAGDGVTPVETTYFAAYDAITTKGSALNAPVATYKSLNAGQPTENATVTEANSGTLNATGTYTYTAYIDENYEITNPTVTVLIDGGKITGYILGNTDEGTEEWYDGNAHAAAKLTEAETKTDGVTVKYSIDGGTTWVDTMPNVTEVGKNEVQMKLTADGYYDQIQKVNFEIKNVEYKVEKSDWVTGWDIVLVYTNDTVPGFKYNGKMMYNLSNMANKYTHSTGTYDYVYGLVINGDADITLVVPSNEAATAIDYNGETTGTGTQSSQYDVNSSNNIDINDLVAVQGIYNVDTLYMNDGQMSVVLRADVNRDKKVDTMDCSQIKVNSGSIN